jgi:hypothetical protein
MKTSFFTVFSLNVMSVVDTHPLLTIPFINSLLLDQLIAECTLRALIIPGQNDTGRQTKNSLQSRLKQYTKTRLEQLKSVQLLSKRVRRTSGKHYFMPKRFTNINGRLVNAESRNLINYPLLRALAAPLSDVNHRPMKSLFVLVRF